MVAVLIFAITLLTLWIGLLSWQQVKLREEVGMLIAQLQQRAGKRHIGGSSNKGRRFSGRVDFRMQVDLPGFLRVGEHARSARVVDLSETGCQLKPERGEVPVGASGSLTIEFTDFGSATSRVEVMRRADDGYGLRFVDASGEFLDRVREALKSSYQNAVTREIPVD
ncbi:MAG: PilZ domain-containing protein [Myxococcota bacterium]